MNSSHENLYDKLNNVHASLRKEKEDAHRTKQLAEQRLKLARADREVAEKRGVESRTQLQQLKTRTMEMKASNSAVENENKKLEKEYDFQHSELQSKKVKLTRLEDKRVNEANNRNSSLSAAREMLRRLRDNSSNNDSTTNSHASWTKMWSNLSSEQMKKRLQHTMEVDGKEQLLRSLPELVMIRKSQKVEEVKDLEMKNASMRRIVAGYQNLLGVESMGSSCGREITSPALRQ